MQAVAVKAYIKQTSYINFKILQTLKPCEFDHFDIDYY